jgi:hypothetical protein
MFRRSGRFLHPVFLAGLLPALLTLPATPARAREVKSFKFMAADEEMVQKLLRVRTRDELATELETARNRKAAAEADLAEMEGIGSLVGPRVEMKRQEIELLKQRSRLAKKEKDAGKVAELEAQRKQEERQLEVFEAMREAADGQLDRARAARDFAQARIDLQEVELHLVTRREARLARATESPNVKQQEDLVTLDRQIREASRKVLSSIHDYAVRSERLARATESLARKNLRLLDVWEEYR